MLKDFKTLMTVRFLFTFAVQMQAVILGWRMYDLTHDPLFLGLIGLAEAIPALGLALYAGYIVDRSRPLVVYRRVLWVSFFSGVTMLISAIPELGWRTRTQVVALFLASMLTGTVRGFAQSAIYAVIPRLVPRERLSQATAWMSSALQVARISGPALGGLIFGWTSILFSAGVICAVLFVASLCMNLIQVKIDPPPISKQKNHLLRELFSGAAFVWSHPILLPALTLDMVSVLFGGVTALLPIYASDILMVGPKGLGLLRGAPAIGATLMSLWMMNRDFRSRAGIWLFVAVSGFGVSIFVFSLSRDFYLSLIALGMSGVFDSVSMIIRSSAVQLASPDNMRGRISAVNSIFIGSSNELGEVESGIAARLLGPVPAAVFGSIMCLFTVGSAVIFSPALRKMDLRKLGS